MILFDAFPLIGWLIGEPVEDEVRELLDRDEPAVPMVNLLEVFDYLLRRRHVPEGDLSVVRNLLREQVTVVPLHEELSFAAAQLRARHYHRSRSALSLPDCVLVATAMSLGAAVVTSDPPVADLARSYGLTLIPVPDSTGRRP